MVLGFAHTTVRTLLPDLGVKSLSLEVKIVRLLPIFTALPPVRSNAPRMTYEVK